MESKIKSFTQGWRITHMPVHGPHDHKKVIIIITLVFCGSSPFDFVLCLFGGTFHSFMLAQQASSPSSPPFM
jgi:hypothetical protein